MTAPTYYGPNDLEAFLRAWADQANQVFGLHARLAFDRLRLDLRAAEARHEMTSRDLHLDIECLEADLKQARGY